MSKDAPASGSAVLAVNGRALAVARDPLARLADVLRDDLGLTGTKIGCNAGDCGACTVLIDGEVACACLVPLGQCSSAAITTIEGLAADPAAGRLREAFLRHGAAQCGICTPGMLVTAAAHLARKPAPTRESIIEALGGVLCRCTGYAKIIDAVLAAACVGPVRGQTPCGRASALASMTEARGLTPDTPPATPSLPREGPEPGATGFVGASIPKVDGRARIEGTERFGADGIPQPALFVRALRSPHARARFAIGDMAPLLAARPGILRVLTAADVPHNGHGIYPDIKDQPVLADREVRYRGEAVLAVIGTRAALEALRDEDVPISWEPLEPVTGIDAAVAAGAPRLHEGRPGNILADGGVRHGDIATALATAAHIASARVETGFVEHAYIEPEAGWAVRRGDTLEVHVSTQTPYQHRDELAMVLGLASEQVRIIPTACGGGFGGKLDLNVHPLMALGAWLAGQPVAYVYTRPESMAASTKRHPARIAVTAAADAAGRLVAVDSDAVLDTGAYASWGPTVATRVPIHACGPYRVPHARTRGRACFTNAPPSGAFRGFGVPQAAIASEAAMDALADRLGMDWLAFRRLNALRTGDRTITGQRLDTSCGIVATIDAVAPWWERWSAAARDHNLTRGIRRRGVGIACSWYGIGNTSLSNPSRCRITLDADGVVTLYSGAVDIGQGSNTIMLQIAADALGLPLGRLRLVSGDTALTPDAGKTSASRQTMVSGRACEAAALDLRRRLFALAGAPEGLAADRAACLDISGRQIRIASGNAEYAVAIDRLRTDVDGSVAVGHGRFDPPTTPLDADGQGVPYACYGFATQVALVEVDLELGTAKVLRIAAAHDVGRAINPQQVEGQIEGGIAQGLGLALMEEYLPGRTENLHDYLIPTVGDMPEIIPIIVEEPTEHGPSGAKGVGEPALISTAPAILGAVFKATGARLTRVPALPHRVLAAIRAQGMPT
jgi:CO/xanthine dehydrogenase Mo-binding subunit/aerobic-type carbon monoxide dehydrogenase small subunit (CoxS/CutS family)